MNEGAQGLLLIAPPLNRKPSYDVKNDPMYQSRRVRFRELHRFGHDQMFATYFDPLSIQESEDLFLICRERLGRHLRHEGMFDGHYRKARSLLSRGLAQRMSS
jgi:hypothetical protein